VRSRLPLLGLALLIAAGCGGGSGSGSSGGGSGSSGGKLVVFAASSLIDAFPRIATTYQQQHPGWKVGFEFLGSDQLAAQIEQGDPADVFAAASTRYPEQLQGQNLLGKTTDFATNTLVLATPADNPAGITSANDIGSAKLVVGDPSVPIGAYTLTVLDNLGIKPSSLNVVSQEAKVTDIVTKLELGEADAGFIYVTGAKNPKAAQQWIDLVMNPQGQQVLESDGFGPAPSN
jgi:molybdate transport system substrate-binding protein